MEVDALLSADAARGRVLVAARVALRSHEGASCARYLSALEEAVRDEPPPFDGPAYADLYREASTNAPWMAVSLMTNAEHEGDGARRLWSLAACCDDARTRQLLKSHAVDESRHALLYLGLLDLTFPGLTDPSFRLELNQLSPHYSLSQEVAAVPGSPYARKPSIDDFLQMNIAEIRTTVHHVMQRSAIALHCPENARKRITAIQDCLLQDELKHVAYTAVLIEQLATDLPPSELPRQFRERLRDFNEITRTELAQDAFDGSAACCTFRTESTPRDAAIS